jgi:Uma2 family endonuclease
MTAQTRPATYQDVLDAPEHVTAEIIDGELHMQPRPASRHSYVHTQIISHLDGLFGPGSRGRGPGGWVFITEPELHLGGNVVVPDVVGWHADRYGDVNDNRPFHTLAPDWCCEILSTGSRGRDRIAKSRIYAREGVGFYWIVDPIECELEAFERLESGQWALVGVFDGNGAVRVKPFDAVEMELGRIWGRA